MNKKFEFNRKNIKYCKNKYGEYEILAYNVSIQKNWRR